MTLTSSSAPLRLLRCGTSLLALLLVLSCGKRPNPPGVRGDTPAGGSCAETAQCQSGLSCDGDSGLCVYDRCNSAPDPDTWCAQRLGVQRAVCERGAGMCEEVFGGVGDPCTTDAACRFGAVCEQQRCQETCVSSASCRVAGTSCLPRAEGSATRLCLPSPSCLTVTDPDAFCSDELGLEEWEVQCGMDGTCLPIPVFPGESCRFDLQCFEGVCEGMYCTQLCEEDDDCELGQLCRRRDGEGMERVCQDPTCLDAPDPELYCIQTIGSGARCLPSGQCEIEREAYGSYLLIVDTSVEDACEEKLNRVHSPGADLMYVVAIDEDGTLYAPAVVHSELGTSSAEEENTLDDVALLEEAYDEEAYDEAGCPIGLQTPDRAHVYSMGCGGRIVVGFLTATREPLEFTQYTEFYIGEYQPICAGRGERPSVNENLEVYACSNARGVTRDRDFSSCTRQLTQDRAEAYVALYFGEGFIEE